MTWFRRLLGEKPPPPPVLLRVADPHGVPVEEVELSLTWFPSGRQKRSTHRTAMGLAIVPWLGRERRLRVAVFAGGLTRAVELERDRTEGDRAHDVVLG